MAFIANFMLKNKGSMKKLEEMLEVHSEVINDGEGEMDQEIDLEKNENEKAEKI